MNDKPIVLIEDDNDDCKLIRKAFAEVGVPNPIISFTTCDKALKYLRSTKEDIFLIISDINLPRMNGLDFKRYINEEKKISERTIPFVFLTTTISHYVVKEALKLNPQGYFQKPNNWTGWTEMAKTIMKYWEINVMPGVL
jgi:CheY-like chemotaxis protein